MRNAHFFLCKDKTFVICQSIVRSENSHPFLCRIFTLKDNHPDLKVYEFLLLGLGEILQLLLRLVLGIRVGLVLMLSLGLGLGLCLGLGLWFRLGLGLGFRVWVRVSVRKKECV